MKNIVFLFFLIYNFCLANMASPIVEGSKNATAFSSKNVTILHENIVVHVRKDFKTAKYTIEYTIKSDVVGGQIPLLFLAKDYKDDFKVWIDNKPVTIQDIPNYIIKPEISQFDNFNNSFDEVVDGKKKINISWDKYSFDQFTLDDLKYFETNLSKGKHKIKVEYLANVWIDKSGWVKKYSFRYSLAPAKHWKSFGSLTVTIYQEGKLKIIFTNLGNAIESKIGAVSTWKFDKLPNDNFDIIYNPEISKLAQILISIDPFGIMILCGILLMTIHVAINFWYRKKNPIKKYSWIVIVGSLLVPYLSFYIFLISYDSIDNLIGIEASKQHGYYVFILFWLPIVFVIYLIIIWIIDWIFCSVLLHKTTIDYFNNYS